MWGAPKSEDQYTFMYILKDLHQKNRFKVGISGDPHTRAKREDWRLLGKLSGSPKSIEVYVEWHFETRHAAFYAEQSLIYTLRRQGFIEVDSNNWFEIDLDSLRFILRGLEPLIVATQEHANKVFLFSDARRKDKPYGKHIRARLSSLKQAGESTS